MNKKEEKGKEKPDFQEARVDSSDVHRIQKGLVSAYDVAKARREIEQAKAASKNKEK